LQSRREELPQLLASSSAKADEPVFRTVQDLLRDSGYWIPAFAGMTPLPVSRAPLPFRPAMTMGGYQTRIGIST
jgi:hypothetical protein